MPSRFTNPITANFAWSVVLAAVFVAVPIMAYQDDRIVYGDHAELKLFLICAFGMGGAFSAYFGVGRRILAFFPGFVSGLTTIAMLLYAPSFRGALDSALPARVAWLIQFGIALLPGLLLYWVLRRIRGESDAL